MTLQGDWDETETANAITSIFGYNENSSEGGDERSSAIPWILDDWFHADNRQNPWPSDRENTLGTKSLKEYDDNFPNFRIKTAVEIGFDTDDGQSISNHEVQMVDENLEDPSTLSPITLEGEPDEPYNPFRNEFDDYDDEYEDDYLPANVKGPSTTKDTVNVENDAGDIIEGVRGSIILGGNDPYLVKLKADAVPLDDLTSEDVPRNVDRFYDEIPSFYAFLDFVFMADGTKLARVWDASRYPGHALYVGGEYRDERPFRDGSEWTPRGSVQRAFTAFAIESQIDGVTPFGDPGYFGYENTFDVFGFGDHPVMTYRESGSSLSASTVENTHSEPLFPPLP
jgi:hypothetical protein